MNATGFRRLCILFICWGAMCGHTWAQAGIFGSTDLIEIEIEVDMDELQADRGDEVSYHPAKLRYPLGDSLVELEVDVRARGHFRRQPQICSLPPLKVRIGRKQARGTLFSSNREIKIVNTCRGDMYVKREYLLYRVYGMLTDFSLQVRPVTFRYRDSQRPDSVIEQFGFFLEHQDPFQERMACVEMEDERLRPEQVEGETLALVSLFNYIIGNTDWDVTLEKNLRIFRKAGESAPLLLPYDFDWSGAVGASYTGLAEDYERRKLKRICLPLLSYQRWINHILIREDQIEELYKSCPFLTAKERREAIRYIKDSLRIIERRPFLQMLEELCED